MYMHVYACICKYASMQVCKYAHICKYTLLYKKFNKKKQKGPSIFICKYAHICNYAIMQLCKYASMLIYESMQVCKYASMLVCKYTHVYIIKLIKRKKGVVHILASEIFI